MAKDAKYNHNVSSTGSVFFPLVVETLGFWTDSSVSLLHRIAARTTLRSGVSCGQAFHNLVQQLSIKLWSYNAKMLLHFLSLLPVTEADPPSHSFTAPSTSACRGGPVHSPATDDTIFSDGDHTQSLVDALDPDPTLSLNASCPSDPTDVSSLTKILYWDKPVSILFSWI